MAQIALNKLYYAAITESSVAATLGEETYGTPVALPGVISIDLSFESRDSKLDADNRTFYRNKGIKAGKVSIERALLTAAEEAALCGAAVDENGVLIRSKENKPSPVAILFASEKADGGIRYECLYRCTFTPPSTAFKTTKEGEDTEYQTPKLEGVLAPRNKADADGNHPVEAHVDSDDSGVVAATITGWFTTVYEPDYGA